MRILLALFASAAGLFATIAMVVFMMAGAANMQPEPLATHIRWTWSIGIGGGLCLVAALVLLALSKPGWAAVVGAVPAGALLLVIVWLVIASLR